MWYTLQRRNTATHRRISQEEATGKGIFRAWAHFTTLLDKFREFSSILFFREMTAGVTKLSRKTAQEGENDRDTLCLLREYLPKPDGGICDEGLDGGRSFTLNPPRPVRAIRGAASIPRRGECCPSTALTAPESGRVRWNWPITGGSIGSLAWTRRTSGKCGDPDGKIRLLLDFTGRSGEVADVVHGRF